MCGHPPMICAGCSIEIPDGKEFCSECVELNLTCPFVISDDTTCGANLVLTYDGTIICPSCGETFKLIREE